MSFLEGDPVEMAFDTPLDAVVGRYVLQFQADPATMLRGLASHVRPDGLIAFHELDWDGVRSIPPVPTYDSCCAWLTETLRLSSVRLGVHLPGVVDLDTLLDRMRAEADATNSLVIGHFQIGAWAVVPQLAG